MRRVPFCLSWPQFVSDASNCDDNRGISRVRLDLLPARVELHSQRVLFQCTVFTQDAIQQVVVREKAQRRLQELLQNPELLWLKLHGSALRRHLAAIHIE
jgi:hypothetical protein